MLIEELKPIIDERYRTLTDKANTAIGGSSLGGLVSLYLGLTHPDVFGSVAVDVAVGLVGNRAMIVGCRRSDGPNVRACGSTLAAAKESRR